MSEAFTEAVRDGGSRIQRAYVTPAGGTEVEVALVGFTVTAARDTVARYSGTVTLAPGVDRALVEPYGAAVRIVDGFRIQGSEQTVPVGTMRIDDVDSGDSGAVELTCVGFEKAVEDARFRQPRLIENTSIVNAIGELLAIAVRSVSVRATRDAPAARVVYERERWAAIDGSDASLARSVGAEVYCDADGGFVIANIPTVDDAPVWTVDAGAGGVLVGYRVSATRSGVYNVVVAENDRVEQDQPEIRGVATDSDPASPTWVGGPFGEVPRFYSSPLLAYSDQAVQAAQALLENSRGLLRTLSFTTTPNPALEPGDVVDVTIPGRISERHLIDSITHRDSGAQTIQTRSTQTVA